MLRVTDAATLDAAVAEAQIAGAHLLVAQPGIELDEQVATAVTDALDADAGVASVSLIDRSGLLAFEADDPGGTPTSPQRTDASVTEALARSTPGAVSIPYAAGAAVVLSRHALSRVPTIPTGTTLDERLRAWSAATGTRALCHLLWAGVLVDGTSSPTASGQAASGQAETVRGTDPTVRADLATRVRVALRGLRIHIDGRTLEGPETGTEVHTLQLIGALARRPEVSYVGVNLRAAIPAYATEILSQRGVNAIEHCGEWRSDLPRVDVFHRPYQPLSGEDTALWSEIGARRACHMQDLITFLSPEYHPSTDAWRTWRGNVRRAVAAVDGVFTISQYVRAQLLREGLRGDPEVVWSAPCGVDHVLEGAPVDTPPELADHRRPFALALGSSYGHKNGDLAAAAVAAVNASGGDLTLVTAGRQVEGFAAAEVAPGHAIHLGRNTSSAERNWLLGNAAVLVFATSAEGFGLVPFEAAAYGTPTVCVSFGALAEHLGPLPVATPDWSVAAFAHSIRTIVEDRAAATAQVQAIRQAGAALSWDRTASIVLSGYREILRRPSRV